MEKIIISNEAYEEFKSFLQENNVESKNIRVAMAGGGCGGPTFGVCVGEVIEGDLVENINDINFIINENLYNEYGVFTLLSTKENDGLGMTIRPLIEPIGGGCAGCSGCH